MKALRQSWTRRVLPSPGSPTSTTTAPACQRLSKSAKEHSQLSLAADRRDLAAQAAAAGGPSLGPAQAGADQGPGILAQHDLLGPAPLKEPFGGGACHRAYQDDARPGDRLQGGGRAHHFSHRPVKPRPGARRAHHRRARLDPDAQGGQPAARAACRRR